MADFAIGTEIKGSDKASGKYRRFGQLVGNDLTRSFKRAGRAAKGFGRAVKGIGKVGAIAGAGIAAAGLALNTFVTNVAQSGDDLAKFSRRAGIAAQTYAELRHAAELAGVGQDEFDSAIVKMNRNLGELRAGIGPLTTLLKKVNPAFLEQLSGIKDNETALQAIIEAMGRLEDPSKRAALAAAAFGRSGQKMTLLMEAGTEGLAASRAEFRKFAGVIDKQALSASESFIDAQTRVKLSIQGVKWSIGQQLLPVLTPMLEDLAQWVATNRELVASKVKGFIEAIARFVRDTDWGKVAKGFSDAFSVIGKILSTMWDLKTVILAIAGTAVLGRMVSLFQAAATSSGLVAANMGRAKTAAAGVAVGGAGGAGAVAGAGGRVGGALSAAGKALPIIGAVFTGAEFGKSIIPEGSVGTPVKKALFGNPIKTIAEGIGNIAELTDTLENFDQRFEAIKGIEKFVATQPAILQAFPDLAGIENTFERSIAIYERVAEGLGPVETAVSFFKFARGQATGIGGAELPLDKIATGLAAGLGPGVNERQAGAFKQALVDALRIQSATSQLQGITGAPLFSEQKAALENASEVLRAMIGVVRSREEKPARAELGVKVELTGPAASSAKVTTTPMRTTAAGPLRLKATTTVGTSAARTGAPG